MTGSPEPCLGILKGVTLLSSENVEEKTKGRKGISTRLDDSYRKEGNKLSSIPKHNTTVLPIKACFRLYFLVIFLSYFRSISKY